MDILKSFRVNEQYFVIEIFWLQTKLRQSDITGIVVVRVNSGGVITTGYRYTADIEFNSTRTEVRTEWNQ